jgi:hypothetical protein
MLSLQVQQHIVLLTFVAVALGLAPVPVGNLIRLASEAESRNVSGL